MGLNESFILLTSREGLIQGTLISQVSLLSLRPNLLATPESTTCKVNDLILIHADFLWRQQGIAFTEIFMAVSLNSFTVHLNPPSCDNHKLFQSVPSHVDLVIHALNGSINTSLVEAETRRWQKLNTVEFKDKICSLWEQNKKQYKIK